MPPVSVLFFISIFFLLSATFEDVRKDLEFGTPEIKIKAIDALAKSENKEYVKEITTLLADEDPRIRIAAVRGLYHLNARDKIDILMVMLSDPSPEVRANVRKVLISFGEFDKIIQNLDPEKQQNAEIRFESAIILGESGIRLAYDNLIKALKDNDSVRFAAVKALGDLGIPEAIEQLRKILKDPVGDIRLQAARSLVKLRAFIAVPEVMDLLEDKDPGVSAEIENVLNGFIAPESELFFVDAIQKDKRPRVRKFSAQALGLLGDRAAAFVVFNAVSDKDEGVRDAAMKSFELLVDSSVVFYLDDKLRKAKPSMKSYIISMSARAGDPRAVPSLLDQMSREKSAEVKELLQKTSIEISANSLSYYLAHALKSENVQVRITVVTIIGQLKLKELLYDLLRKFSIEKNREVKIAILTALKDISDRSVIPELNEALLTEKDMEIKVSILEVLKHFKDPSSIPNVLACFRYENDTLSMEAESFLDLAVDMQSLDNFETAIKSKNMLEKTYALKVAKKFPVAKSLKIVLLATEEKDIFIRRDATQLLGQIGDRSAIPTLGKLLNDKEEEIRLEAVKSLSQIGDPSVISLMEKPLKDKSPAVRLEAVKIYAVYGDTDSVKLLNNALKKEKDDSVSKQISIVLKEFANPSSIPNFRENLFKNDYPELRREAALGLGRIGDRGENNEIVKDLVTVFRKDPEPEVVSAAMLSLARLKVKEMASEFMQKVGDPLKSVSDSAKQSLDILLDDSDINYVIDCLQDESEKVREYCILKLSKMKSEKTPPDLFNALGKTTGKLRTKVMLLIEQFADDSTLPYFLSVIKNPSVNTDVELHKWVIKNISRRESKDVINFLKASIRNSNADIRLEVAGALGSFNSAPAQEMLRYISEKDESPSVRSEAKKYVR
ncbi:MAG: HEAT repeat domain-containing protein [Elusimicrobiota bacterium]